MTSKEYESINDLCDMLRSLIINPQYIKDLIEAKTGSMSKRKKFLKKYKIFTPIEYDLVKKYTPVELMHARIFIDVDPIPAGEDSEGWPSIEALKNADLKTRKITGITGKYFNKSSKEISDKEFFEFLRCDPIFLQSPCALEKIELWEEELHSEKDDISFTAQEHLKKIGTTLALKRPWKSTDKLKTKVDVAPYRYNVLRIIKTERITKMRNKNAARLRVKELFKEDIKDIPDTDAVLANLITAKKYNLTPSTVARYIKDCTKVQLDANNLMFITKR